MYTRPATPICNCILTICFFCMTCISCQGHCTPNRNNEPSAAIIAFRQIHLPILLPGQYLVLGVKSDEILSIPLLQKKMYVKSQNKYKQILSLNDLKNRVHIKTKSDAMLFVRLYTAPEFSELFSPSELEIIPISEINANLFYGNKRLYKNFLSRKSMILDRESAYASLHHDVKKWLSYWGFTLRPNDWLPLPSCKEVAGGYHITRIVGSNIIGEQQPVSLFRIEEKVGYNGSYKITTRRQLKIPSKFNYFDFWRHYL
jgi:hypothetical protein